jgi:putative membrane protein
MGRPSGQFNGEILMEKDQRGSRFYGLLYLKGLAMGAADVVPGVSGGTIAFITGIYQELLDTIKGVKPTLLLTWKNEGFKAAWKALNGNFLLALLGGIFTSIITLAKGITFMLTTYPILVWAFFFGLIIASTVIIAKYIKHWNVTNVVLLALGAAFAYYITIAAPSQIPDGLLYVFLSGAIAICAMILPGISGSFILLLLGAYASILGSISAFVDALKSFDVDAMLSNGTSLSVFIAGCAVGIISFSYFLTWLFKKAYHGTMAALTGFMVGSLNKVWPWKEVTQYRMNSHGEEVPFLEHNVSPANFEMINGEPALVMWAIICCIAGFLLVFIMEKAAERA